MDRLGPERPSRVAQALLEAGPGVAAAQGKGEFGGPGFSTMLTRTGRMARMPTYIAFLRAINVGKRMFAKGAIVQACEDAGCTDVETYINTGNVRVTTKLRSRAKVEATLEKAFASAAGFDVPTIVFTPKELTAVAADAEELSAGHSGLLYVSLLKDTPTAAAVKKLDGAGKEGERAEVRGRAAHLLLGNDYHSAMLSNAVVEKHLGVATNRNVKVIRTLAEKWGDGS